MSKTSQHNSIKPQNKPIALDFLQGFISTGIYHPQANRMPVELFKSLLSAIAKAEFVQYIKENVMIQNDDNVLENAEDLIQYYAINRFSIFSWYKSLSTNFIDDMSKFTSYILRYAEAYLNNQSCDNGNDSDITVDCIVQFIQTSPYDNTVTHQDALLKVLVSLYLNVEVIGGVAFANYYHNVLGSRDYMDFALFKNLKFVRSFFSANHLYIKSWFQDLTTNTLFASPTKYAQYHIEPLCGFIPEVTQDVHKVLETASYDNKYFDDVVLATTKAVTLACAKGFNHYAAPLDFYNSKD